MILQQSTEIKGEILFTGKLFWGKIYCWFLTEAQHIGKGHLCILTDFFLVDTHEYSFFYALRVLQREHSKYRKLISLLVYQTKPKHFIGRLFAQSSDFLAALSSCVLIGVDYFVCIHCSWLFAFVITLFAADWLITWHIALGFHMRRILPDVEHL